MKVKLLENTDYIQKIKEGSFLLTENKIFKLEGSSTTILEVIQALGDQAELNSIHEELKSRLEGYGDDQRGDTREFIEVLSLKGIVRID
jgi:hypothetical protein